MKKIGDKRLVKRFALFPTKMADNRYVWFKWFGKHQVCIKITIPGERYAPGWTTPESDALVWKTVSKRELIWNFDN